MTRPWATRRNLPRMAFAGMVAVSVVPTRAQKEINANEKLNYGLAEPRFVAILAGTRTLTVVLAVRYGPVVPVCNPVIVYA